MKRFFILTVFLLSTVLCYSQVTITMEESNGIYKIPCSVNGLKMKFIFDTGASAVSLSASMADFMVDNGYLNKEDFRGTAKTKIADGTIVDVITVNLRDFEVGGFHLSNVLATINRGQDVPLLMGQTAIEKLGRISLIGNQLIIHKPKVKLSSAEIATLRKQIASHFKAQKWEQVVAESSQLKDATTFNNQWDYYYYMLALRYNDEFDPSVTDLVLSLCDEWESSNITTSNKVRSELYEEKAYFLSTHKWDNEASFEYLQKALKYCTPYNKYSILSSMSDYYDGVSNGDYALHYRKRAIEAYYDYKDISLAMVLNNKVKDNFLGFTYWRCAQFEEEYNRDYSERNYYLKLSAKCGFPEAIDFCFENNINYTK